MNKELKFRAWHKIEKRFVDVRDINFESDTIGYDCKGEANYYDVAKFSDVVIQQCTGLLDKHGKEIYEGDLVNFLTYHTEETIPWEKLEVVYDSSLAMFAFKGATDLFCMYDHIMVETMEVTGNIFESLEENKK